MSRPSSTYRSGHPQCRKLALRMAPVTAALLLMLGVGQASAGSTQSWTTSTGDQLAAGTLEGTSIDAQGQVVLAPRLEALWGPDEGIVWAVQPDGGGGAFIATSGPGRVLRVGHADEPQVWYEAGEENLVTALLATGDGTVYAGLSPRGGVVRLTGPEEEPSIIETEATFVWALAHGSGDTLWIGTGVPGRLLRSVDGSSAAPVFESEDDPVRSIAALPDGGVVIGTGGRGRVIRIGSDGQPFVLFDADEPEVVAVAVAANGRIYALTSKGAKQVGGSSQSGSAARTSSNSTTVVATAPPNGNTSGGSNGAGDSAASPSTPRPRQRLNVPAGGALYALDPDGGVRRVWLTETEMPFAMTVTDDGDVLVATGDAGSIHVMDGEGRDARVLRIASDQASAMTRGDRGDLLIGGTTDARVSRLGPGLRQSGSYVSTTIDAGTVADWGHVLWSGELPAGTKQRFAVRAGNTADPDETWTDWVAAPKSAVRDRFFDTALPPARFCQVRVQQEAAGDRSPRMSRLEVFYLPRNRAPVVTDLVVEPAGIVWARGPAQSSNRSGPLVADDPVARKAAATLRGRGGTRPLRKAYEQGVRTFSWVAEDPDQDRLTYTLEVRGESSAHWFPLARELREAFFSWDARGMPDGVYRARLTATDSLDNPQTKQLSHSWGSDAFKVDNTRPYVGLLEQRRKGQRIEVEFIAVDAEGSIASVEVALDGGKWEPLDPTDGIADSVEELYYVEVEAAEDASRSMMVRATDAVGNLGGEMWVITGEE